MSHSLVDCFADVPDPRPRAEDADHPLVNLLTIAVCAVICGADDFTMIAHIGRERKDWFSKFLDLKNGIPSHDTFNRVLAALNPRAFEECLLAWITALHDVTEGGVIAIDGKTLRRSYDRGSNKAAIHMVSAWATENHLSLGQTVTDAKSNEITAIPKLLELIEIHGCLVTLDAMGCQTAIAEKIVQEGGDYVLAVKDNQPTLHQGLRDFFRIQLEADFADHKASYYETSQRAHQREERRYYYVCPVPKDLPDASRWPKLRAIGLAISDIVRDGQNQVALRYYILSQKLSAKRFGEAVRSHWSIENRLHWQLDVSFGEDQSRIRQKHAAENFSILRRTALSLLKNETSKKLGIKNKRLTAALSTDYLTKVLTAQ